jgi:hypothetical protein
MKEMTPHKKTILGGSVKKTLLVAALAAMFLFAVAGSAMAVNHSGQLRFGASSLANASNPTSATIVGGGTNTYTDWSTTINYGGNAGAGNSPHGNFTTSTVKCVVCHAVHYAAPGGAPVGSGQTADTLLRMRADQACMYCHATAGEAVNGTPVYNGLSPTDGGGGATNEGHATGSDCSLCHCSVHGANQDNSVASLVGFMLIKLPVAAVGPQAVPTSDMIGAVTAIDLQAQNQGFAPGAALAGTIGDYASVNTPVLREQAVGVFCAECHNGAYATGAAGASTNVRGSDAAQFSGHRIAALATSNWNADGSKSSGRQDIGAVAFAAATNCKSCHDANDTFGNGAFPHSWGGTKMWLMVASDAGAAKTALPYGTAAGSAYNDQSPQLSDGVCLKCHVASGGTAGVGITF